MTHTDASNGGGRASVATIPPEYQTSYCEVLPAAAISTPEYTLGGSASGGVRRTLASTATISSLELAVRELAEIRLWQGLEEFDEQYANNNKAYSWAQLELYDARIQELRRRGANPQRYERHLRFYQRTKKDRTE